MLVLTLHCDGCAAAITHGAIYYELGEEVFCKTCAKKGEKIRDADCVRDGVIHV
jgi:uncharacterized Zn-finger protein